jgi:branched-chain amino acid transport system ATP-binding protein
MTLLAIEGLDVGYGDSQVLWQASLTVENGEIVALVGANGAGKTTLLRTIAGLIAPSVGRITYAGRDIATTSAEERVRLGIALVPEGRRLFSGLTAIENLRIGAYSRHDPAAVKRDLDRVLAHFPELERLEKRLAGTLSGGEQQMCAIGRALMSEPRLLLLDEPSAGLAPVVVQQVFGLVERIRSSGLTVLIVEQNVRQVLRVVDRAYLLEAGTIRAAGSAAELSESATIKEAYLGV